MVCLRGICYTLAVFELLHAGRMQASFAHMLWSAGVYTQCSIDSQLWSFMLTALASLQWHWHHVKYICQVTAFYCTIACQEHRSPCATPSNRQQPLLSKPTQARYQKSYAVHVASRLTCCSGGGCWGCGAVHHCQQFWHDASAVPCQQMVHRFPKVSLDF